MLDLIPYLPGLVGVNVPGFLAAITTTEKTIRKLGPTIAQIERRKQNLPYYRKIAAHDPRPLFLALWLLNLYCGTMRVDSLLRKMRTTLYRPYLFVLEDLKLVERKELERQKPGRKRKPTLGITLPEDDIDRPRIRLTLDEIVEAAKKGELQKLKVPTTKKKKIPSGGYRTLLVLTDSGRQFAQRVTQTNTLQVTRTRRYRP
jgi:hypothetical protein